MFVLLITVLVFTDVLTVGNNLSYHESAPRSVTIYRTNSSAELPLLLQKMGPSSAICFPNSTAHQLVTLSLAICRTLGYDALQRIYPVNAHIVDNMYHSKGLLLDVNCNTPEPELQHCKWRYIRKVPCQLYLGVHCAECNHVVEILDDTKQEIEFPMYMPCYPHGYCEWNIRNNHTMKKTVLEFNRQNTDTSLSNAIVSNDAGQILEVTWLDTGNGTQIKIKESFTRVKNMGPIKIQSSSITVRYFFVDCQFFDPTRIKEGNIASLIYYNEEYVSDQPEITNFFIPVALCALLMTFIIMIVACISCYIRKMKQNLYRKHDFTMTYIPGLNITYEEDETNPTDSWPAVYHKLNMEDQNVCLFPFTSHDSNRSRTSENELGPATKFHHAEPLRNLVTQLATQHRKSFVDVQKFGPEEEDDVFSCNSQESLHSYYSVYPATCHSLSSSDSFISVGPDIQTQHSAETEVI